MRALDHHHQRARRPALGVDLLHLHDLLEQPELVVGIQNGELRRQSNMFGVPAQHAGAKRVKRAEPQPFHRSSQDCANTFAHLTGGLVGEGDGQDLVRVGTAGQQKIRESGGQHTRLPGAGTGQHEQRTIHSFDGFPLLSVKSGEVVVHTDREYCTAPVWANQSC